MTDEARRRARAGREYIGGLIAFVLEAAVVLVLAAVSVVLSALLLLLV